MNNMSEKISMISRRDFLKLAGIGGFTAWVTMSCLGLGDNPQTNSAETPYPTFGVDMFKLYPDKSLFTSEKLFGNIVKVEDVPLDDLNKYKVGLEFAASKEGIRTNDPNIDTVTFGLKFTDNVGTTRDGIFVLLQPKPIEGLSEAPKNSLYFYSGIEANNFVSPDEAKDKTAGRLFPVVYAIDNANILHTGLGKEITTGKYQFTVPLYDMAIETRDVTYTDPYSGSKVSIKNENAPDGIKKGFASLVPVEFLEVFSSETLTVENLVSHKWGKYTFIENSNGYYEMKDSQGNLIPEVKLFKDGTAERTVKFNGRNEILTVAFQAITVGENGQLILGVWEYQNGAWSEAITDPAPKSAEDTANFHTLAILQGHEKEQAMIDTVFLARDMAFSSENYRPMSEFENISVTYNFNTYDNFDVKPKEWIFQNWDRQRPGEFKFRAVSPDSNGIAYEDGTSTSNARPMQVALGSGWFNLEIYNTDGTQQPDTINVPILAMNADRSLIDVSALLRQDDLKKVVHLLTKESRGRFFIRLYDKPIRDDGWTMTDGQLTAFVADINQEYFETIGGPKLDNSRIIKSLYKELGQTFFTFTVDPADQVN